jgi:hypothetical protein
MADPWTEALQEAYASIPADKKILATLEFRHVSFPAHIRIVRDYGSLLVEDYEGEGWDLYGHMMTLEAGAPVNSGEEVMFQALMFEIQLPKQAETETGVLQIDLDNVTKIISKYLDAVVVVRDSIDVSYREFMYDDMSAPHFYMHGLQMHVVTTTTFHLTATAEFTNLVNKKFPNKEYLAAEYRGLTQT